jgi:hypothetical protein
MAYRNQLLSEGKTIYHVFDVATNRKVASFLNENYAHNCAANRSFDNLFVVVEEHPSGHIEKTVYLDGDILNEMTIGDIPPPVFPWKPKTPRRPRPIDPWESPHGPITPSRPIPKPNDPWGPPYEPIAPKRPRPIDPDQEEWFKRIRDKLKEK